MCSLQPREQCAVVPVDNKLFQVFKILLNTKRRPGICKSIRATCQALLYACDQTARRIRLNPQAGAAPTGEEVAATLRRAAARGRKPEEAFFYLPEEHINAIEETLLAFLSGLASGGAPIAFIRIANPLPTTESIVRAIDALGPQLTRLTISWSCPEEPKQQPVQTTSSVSDAFRLLLQLVGHRLQGLHQEIIGGPSPSGFWDEMTRCTALTRLDVSMDMHKAIDRSGALSGETSMLRALSSLTSLRDLSLSGGARPSDDLTVRAARAAHLEACLTPLTALTRLDIRLHCLEHVQNHTSWGDRDIEPLEPDLLEITNLLEAKGSVASAEQLKAVMRAEWRALAAAALRMPRLAVLRTQAVADVTDVTALAALTDLQVGALVLPPPAASTQQPAAEGTATAEGAPTATTSTLYYLPPLLKRLVVFSPLSVRLAQMLRRSPPAAKSGPIGGGGTNGERVAAPEPSGGVISWEAPELSMYEDVPYWILAFSKGDANDSGQLTSGAAAAVRAAAVSLKSVFRFKLRAKRFYLHYGPRLYLASMSGPLMPPREADGTHCGTWLGAVVSELRPLSLRLRDLVLYPRDMFAMTTCLEGVKVLDLRNSCYSVSSLPLLADLVTLEQLYLRAEDWMWPDESDLGYRSVVLQAAFLGLAAPSRRMLAFQAGRTAAGEVVATEDDLYSCPAALPLPRLRVLQVLCSVAAWEDWLTQCLEEAEDEFGRRPEPPTVRVTTYMVE